MGKEKKDTYLTDRKLEIEGLIKKLQSQIKELQKTGKGHQVAMDKIVKVIQERAAQLVELSGRINEIELQLKPRKKEKKNVK